VDEYTNENMLDNNSEKEKINKDYINEDYMIFWIEKRKKSFIE